MAVYPQLQQNGGSNQVYGSRTINLTDTWIVWSASGTIEWSVPQDWKARAYQTLDGQTTKITSQKLFIGSSPMMLRAGDRFVSQIRRYELAL